MVDDSSTDEVVSWAPAKKDLLSEILPIEFPKFYRKKGWRGWKIGVVLEKTGVCIFTLENDYITGFVIIAAGKRVKGQWLVLGTGTTTGFGMVLNLAREKAHLL